MGTNNGRKSTYILIEISCKYYTSGEKNLRLGKDLSSLKVTVFESVSEKISVALSEGSGFFHHWYIDISSVDLVCVVYLV